MLKRPKGQNPKMTDCLARPAPPPSTPRTQHSTDFCISRQEKSCIPLAPTYEGIQPSGAWQVRNTTGIRCHRWKGNRPGTILLAVWPRLLYTAFPTCPPHRCGCGSRLEQVPLDSLNIFIYTKQKQKKQKQNGKNTSKEISKERRKRR